ncbi:MAG TPA: LPS export ABC transporter permease LptG [Syntrophales bacterium]|nr:LPS export ABC transporter permease LptG [Syntrophales bacterium]
MTILDRYVTREFVRLFFLILALFTALFMIVEFVERIRMFLSNSATLMQMVSYFIYMLPMMVSQTIPVSVLLAALMTFSILSKNSEVLAMKANGISLYRMSLPVFIVSILISIFAFLNSELVTPYSNQKADNIVYIEVQKRQVMGSLKQNQLWYRAQNGIYNFRIFDHKTKVVQGITINYLDKNFTLTARLDAEKAEWKDGKWTFYNLMITRFGGEFPALEWASSRVIDLPEKPDDFNLVQKEAEKMGFVELKNYIGKLESEGFDATRYLVDLHGKIAFTLVIIILVAIGISFSLMKTERSGGVMPSIGIGIVIGFSYWIVHAFSMSLGRSGSVPPVLSAWFANIILGTVSVIMFLRVKT